MSELLTDAELARWEADANEAIDALGEDPPTTEEVYSLLVHTDMLRLIEEIRRLRALTTCDCGLPRSVGKCSGHCDNDE